MTIGGGRQKKGARDPPSPFKKWWGLKKREEGVIMQQ